MQILAGVLPDFGEIFHIAFLFVTHGGWLLFLCGLIYILWRLYLSEIQHQFSDKLNWTYLSIRVPKENRASTLGVEQIFTQLHALHRSYTFMQKYVEGATQLWYSFEIISLGGKINFVARIPSEYQSVFEAAVYSQYPQAEITEVADYMANFQFVPEESEYDVLGSEFKMTDDQVIPLKTYKDFEHPSAEEKIIDPLGNLFESLAKINEHDFVGVQILAQPLGDEEWQPLGARKVRQLTEEEEPHKKTFLGALLSPLEWFARFSYRDAILGGGHGHGSDENKPRNNWLNMTEAQRERVNLIERKIGKPGYKVKIRFIYIAPKNKIDKYIRFLIVGAFRHLGSVMTNRLKPDGNTWIGVDPVFSESLERFYLDKKLRFIKTRHLKGYAKRDIHLGSSQFILNVEELATLYHFPITAEGTTAPAAIEKTESKKSQPPINLPVAEGEI
ncbi:MAG TPA: hypothetical protein VHA30_02300 [Patescibacteria group bacterium]|nr:hypothetical protein [Patescibacteria group bacterium]